ncbi:Lsr2 family protein [Leifsonia sp. NPDC058248]|uniref:histone-like nucleoid-structuring protein Lsr2 n=1 Tax=Leifsonia sp. NPDC058248 TaxID=3346402 RepID=UPI0036D8C48E
MLEQVEGDVTVSKRLIYELLDDLDQQPIPAGTGETVRFSLDGATYEIDLSDEHVARLRADFEQWIGAAHRVEAASGDVATTKHERRMIRDWAREQGLGVSEKGQIPRSIIEEFRKAR